LNQIGIVFDTIEKYPLVVLGFSLVVVCIGGAMYRVLLQPKLKRIEEVANANTDRIVGIRDDLNVKHYELKSDIKDLVHSQGENMKSLVRTLMDGITSQIDAMNHHNERQHGEIFIKVDELGKCHHEVDKRLTILEKK